MESANRSQQELQQATTLGLVSQLAGDVRELVKKEVELARTELRHDVRAEAKAAAGIGIAGMCTLLALQLMLAALVLALTAWLTPASAALAVAALVLAVGTVTGLVGWAKRVRKPIERTQRTLKEDARWMKEQTS